jgi:ATP-dependent DNA helicase RecQ
MDHLKSLRAIFGFDDFRAGQAEAIAAALADRDALVVMPTGSGKSLCYQLPALIREDLTLVVSPLVSLMQDQAAALERVAPSRVGVVNALRGALANAEAVDRAVAGELSLLYVAPERFASIRFVDRIRQARVGLFVVDEAHCVSQWGHDFRPDYFSLADAARIVGARATMAVTATATPSVAADIVQRLGLRDPLRIATGFDRPNLSFAVVRCDTPIVRGRRLSEALADPGALPAIVYVGTRDNSDVLAEGLARKLGHEVVSYHAGLDRGARARVQERFMTGEVQAIVATNAFGMGIDKSDVRTVCHAAVPASLEAYYQEAGRAGRDGLAARCILFAQPRDKGRHVYFIQRSRVEDATFQWVCERLRWAGIDGRYDLEFSELAGARADEEAVRAVIGHLARAELIAPEPSPFNRVAGRLAGEWDRVALALCRDSAREVERARWRQYRGVWDYVERDGCRRTALLRYFGDPAVAAGGTACCDVCASSELRAA